METIKNLIYTGVGLVSLTSDKFTQLVDELVDEKKLSVEEGRKIMDDFVKTTGDKKEDFESQLSGLVEKLMKSLNFATTSDVNTLAERIKALETAQGETPAPTKTKTSTRRTKKTSETETSEEA